jgi:RNA polymerase sigma factor for flagellar operon FliA
VNAVERAQLVERHMDLARKCATMIHARCGKYIDLEELVALANAGLAEAAASYQVGHGTAFSSWAWYRIQGSMLDGLRKSSNLPRKTWATLTALRAANDYLENLGEREAGAARQGAKPKQGQDALVAVKDALASIRTMYMTSLETLQDAGFDKEDPDASPSDQVDRGRMARALRIALSRLPEKERALVTKHYYEGKNLLEAGVELGISKSWASRLHAQAVEKLRAVVDQEADLRAV